MASPLIIEAGVRGGLGHKSPSLCVSVFVCVCVYVGVSVCVCVCVCVRASVYMCASCRDGSVNGR